MTYVITRLKLIGLFLLGATLLGSLAFAFMHVQLLGFYYAGSALTAMKLAWFMGAVVWALPWIVISEETLKDEA